MSTGEWLPCELDGGDDLVGLCHRLCMKCSDLYKEVFRIGRGGARAVKSGTWMIPVNLRYMAVKTMYTGMSCHRKSVGRSLHVFQTARWPSACICNLV